MLCFYPRVIKKATLFIALLSTLFFVSSFTHVGFAAASPGREGHAEVPGIAVADPMIFDFYPMQGYVGDSITISGIDLSAVEGVIIGQKSAGFRIVSDVMIRAVVPPFGFNDSFIILQTSEDPYAFITYGFDYQGVNPTPKLTRSPSYTIVTGFPVDIYGEQLSGTTYVAFGGTPATSITVIDDQHIQAVVGNGSSGPVTVTTPYGTVTGLYFEYSPPDPYIRFFNPHDPHTEGDVITIGGKYFLNGVASITFGGTPPKSFIVANDSTIYAVVDTGASGLVKLLSTRGARSQVDGFEYRPYDEMPPKVYSVYPAAAAAGQTVTLKGKHLSAVSLVYLGYGIPHAFTVTSDTTVETIVTSQDTGNWGYVETPYGATYFSGFRLLPPPGTPVLINATPMYGGEGDTVYIQGDSLHYATNVSFGGVPAASFAIRSDNTIVAIVGGGSSGDITVTTAAGSASLPGFTYVPAPAAARKRSDIHHVGIGQQAHTASIHVYPNPASGAIWVQHPAGANAKIEVVNVIGSVVKLVNVAQGVTQTQLSLGGLPAGYYTVTWRYGGVKYTSAIIVQ